MSTINLPDQRMNGKTLASFIGVSVPVVWYHWRKLRQRDKVSRPTCPLPQRGLLEPEQAQRLANYIQHRRK